MSKVNIFDYIDEYDNEEDSMNGRPMVYKMKKQNKQKVEFNDNSKRNKPSNRKKNPYKNIALSED